MSDCLRLETPQALARKIISRLCWPEACRPEALIFSSMPVAKLRRGANEGCRSVAFRPHSGERIIAQASAICLTYCRHLCYKRSAAANRRKAEKAAIGLIS